LRRSSILPPIPGRGRDRARLVDAGKSVLVIERHLAVMAHADWIIDLGPGAGHDGGRIVFECTPADLVARLRREHPLVEAIERLLRGR
jgi:excinuclease UvrABC ATPase subunit